MASHPLLLAELGDLVHRHNREVLEIVELPPEDSHLQ